MEDLISVLAGGLLILVLVLLTVLITIAGVGLIVSVGKSLIEEIKKK